MDAKECDSYDEYLVDLSKPIKGLQYSISINGVPAFPKGDIQAVKARAKQGKTHTILCIMSAFLSGKCLNIESMLVSPTVSYFATEEQEDSVRLLAKKVHTLCDIDCNKNHNRFMVHSLRSVSPKERLEYIENSITQNEPDVVFIDGVRDLLNDFNNIAESNKTISLLMQLSEEYNCAIVCVLHVNKADSNMRGHLGTELLNKCSDVLEVEKKDNVFNVKETDCRNISTGEWAFSLDENGLPQKAVHVTKKEKRVNKKEEIFSTILADGKSLRFTDLRAEYMKLSNYKTDASNKHISEMTKKGLLSKTDDGKYQLS